MRHQIRNRLDQIRKDDEVRSLFLLSSSSSSRSSFEEAASPRCLSLAQPKAGAQFVTDVFSFLRSSQVILQEGVDSLSVSELQMACQSRGVRFSGVSPSALRRELASWIDLHYTNKISGVLLVLSRAFHFNEEGADVIKSLESTLASLPDNLVRSMILLSFRTLLVTPDPSARSNFSLTTRSLVPFPYSSRKPSSTFLDPRLHSRRRWRFSSSSRILLRRRLFRRRFVISFPLLLLTRVLSLVELTVDFSLLVCLP